MINGTNAKLNKRLNTFFENSSLPSSAILFRKKGPNSRKPSGKKSGVQKGHKAHTVTKQKSKIFSLPTHADVLYSDATASNIIGKRKAVLVCADKKYVLYQHTEHKGHDGLSKTPVKNFEGTIIHDHDKIYCSYGSSHQERRA